MKPVSVDLAAMASPDEPLSLGALFQSHGRYVAGVAFRLLGRDRDVDDVVQDVFLIAASHLGAVRDPRAIKGWLATITVRVVARRLRWRRVQAFFQRQVVPPEPALGRELAPEQRLLLERVYRVLDTMPAPLRLAWSLRHLEEHPLEEVARLCGCSLATAKRRVAAAHERVRKQVADE